MRWGPFSHKTKYRVCTCHPIWRSPKVISLHFINIRKQRFWILHICSSCLFAPADRSSLPNVSGQESEWHDCIICEGNAQYNMNLNKWIKKPSPVRSVWSPALPFTGCWLPLSLCSSNVFSPALSSETWIASFKLCVTAEDLKSVYSLWAQGLRIMHPTGKGKRRQNTFSPSSITLCKSSLHW